MYTHLKAQKNGDTVRSTYVKYMRQLIYASDKIVSQPHVWIDIWLWGQANQYKYAGWQNVFLYQILLQQNAKPV